MAEIPFLDAYSGKTRSIVPAHSLQLLKIHPRLKPNLLGGSEDPKPPLSFSHPLNVAARSARLFSYCSSLLLPWRGKEQADVTVSVPAVVLQFSRKISSNRADGPDGRGHPFSLSTTRERILLTIFSCAAIAEERFRLFSANIFLNRPSRSSLHHQVSPRS